jgi:hypothetical protein
MRCSSDLEHLEFGATLVSAAKASRTRRSGASENMGCFDFPNMKVFMHCGSASIRELWLTVELCQLSFELELSPLPIRHHIFPGQIRTRGAA